MTMRHSQWAYIKLPVGDIDAEVSSITKLMTPECVTCIVGMTDAERIRLIAYRRAVKSGFFTDSTEGMLAEHKRKDHGPGQVVCYECAGAPFGKEAETTR